MKNYLLSVIHAVIFIVVAEFFTVKGKNGKLTKMVLSLVTISIFFSPISKILSSENNFSVNLNENYYNYLINLEEETLKNEIISAVKPNYNNLKSVTLNLNCLSGENSTKKVTLTFNCDGINCNTAHINITKEVQNLINEKFNFNSQGVEIIVKFEK